MARSIKVFVGHAWQKRQVENIKSPVTWDQFWKSIRIKFIDSCKTMQRKSGCRIEFARLKASIGQYILPSVMRKIENADILIFDVTNVDSVVSSHKMSAVDAGLNPNVLIELGAAIALKKEVILMCSSAIKLPSDLSGIFVAKYVAAYKCGELIRTFEDEKSVSAAFVGMLRRAIRRNKVEEMVV